MGLEMEEYSIQVAADVDFESDSVGDLDFVVTFLGAFGAPVMWRSPWKIRFHELFALFLLFLHILPANVSVVSLSCFLIKFLNRSWNRKRIVLLYLIMFGFSAELYAIWLGSLSAVLRPKPLFLVICFNSLFMAAFWISVRHIILLLLSVIAQLFFGLWSAWRISAKTLIPRPARMLLCRDLTNADKHMGVEEVKLLHDGRFGHLTPAAVIDISVLRTAFLLNAISPQLRVRREYHEALGQVGLSDLSMFSLFALLLPRLFFLLLRLKDRLLSILHIQN